MQLVILYQSLRFGVHLCNNMGDMWGESARVAVVIPCFKAARHVRAVVEGIPAWVDAVVVVDDACPQGSGDVAAEAGRPGLEVIRHERNQGVGGAVASGYAHALALGADVIVKMDGDGQMDPAQVERLVAPVAEGSADYAKGNRFGAFESLKAMPPVRLAGNSILSFLVKAASGYWDVLDPTNGYTAIHRDALAKLDFKRIAKGYFFETDMLINLYLCGAAVTDVDIPARYGDEESALNPGRAAVEFIPKLAKGFLRRVALRYFVRDFNMASVYLLLGLPLFAFGLGFGAMEWADSIATGEPKSAGTIMLAALPLIVSFQMLLQAVQIDMGNVPRKRPPR